MTPPGEWAVLPPWPENTVPAPAVLAGWLRTLPMHQAAYVCKELQAAQAEAGRCFIENHDGRLEQQAKTIDALRAKVDHYEGKAGS